MPFVPLSSDGTQHAETEPLPAPRAQVALAPHESGVSVLLVEPDGGLRRIGELDPAVAEDYRRVLAPLAADGLLGTCTAETTGTGTALWLAPAAACVPGADVLAPAVEEAGDAGAAAETVRMESVGTVEETVRLHTARTSIFAPGPAPAPPPPSGNPPAGRVSGRRGAVPWVIGGLAALLVAGAIAQGVGSGGPPDEVPLAAVGAAPVATATRPTAPPSLTPIPVPTPEPATQAAAAPARTRPSRAPAPADTPAPPAEDDEHDEHDEQSHDDESGADEHSDGDSDDSHDSSGDDRDRDDDVRFRSCVEAWIKGAAPIRRGEPGYSGRLDRDGDGVACEAR